MRPMNVYLAVGIAVLGTLGACVENPDEASVWATAALSLSVDEDVDVIEIEVTGEDGDTIVTDFVPLAAPHMMNLRLRPGDYTISGTAFKDDDVVATGQVDGVTILPDVVNQIDLVLTMGPQQPNPAEAPVVIDFNHAPEFRAVTIPGRVETGQPFAVRVSASDPDNDILRAFAGVAGTEETVELELDLDGLFVGQMNAPAVPGQYVIDVTIEDEHGDNSTFKPLFVEPSDSLEESIESFVQRITQDAGGLLVLPTPQEADPFGAETLDAWQRHLDWLNEQIALGHLAVLPTVGGLDVQVNPGSPLDVPGLEVTLEAARIALFLEQMQEVMRSIADATATGRDGVPVLESSGLQPAFDQLIEQMTVQPNLFGTFAAADILTAIAPANGAPVGVLNLGVFAGINVPANYEGVDMDGDGNDDGWIGPRPGGGFWYWNDSDGDGVIDGGELHEKKGASSYRVQQGVTPDGTQRYTWYEFTYPDGSTETDGPFIRPNRG